MIEVLTCAGCPHLELARAVVRFAVDRSGMTGFVDIREVIILDEAHARERRFLGSPTIRVDGVDVDRSSAGRTDFGVQCRLYDVWGRLGVAPPPRWVREMLTRAPADESPPSTPGAHGGLP